ncbi:MAG: hypothetical protein PQJ49_04535 [Sphaerochaetaceae bacterium]|nr:hypothetical protein [Sphaerochaetaceae bacterium]
MKSAKQILNEELAKLDDGKYHSPKEMEVYIREATMEAMEKYADQFREPKEVSFMWHCSDNVMDFEGTFLNKETAEPLNSACGLGFRLALRKLEDLNIIQMSDIDRSISQEDVEIWNKKFEEDECNNNSRPKD